MHHIQKWTESIICILNWEINRIDRLIKCTKRYIFVYLFCVREWRKPGILKNSFQISTLLNLQPGREKRQHLCMCVCAPEMLLK